MELHDLTPIQQVCFLASQDGGRVDLARPRSRRAAAKIDAALQAGAIDAGGWLTDTGWRIAREASA